MVELKLGLKTVDLPYTVRVHGVTEAMFEDLVDEQMKAELLDGEMIAHSAPCLRHDDISGFVRCLARGFAGRRKLGAVLGPDGLIHLARGRLFAPDLFFLKQKRLPRRWPKIFDGVPDWLVESLSPSTRDYDLGEKREAYQEARVPEIWFIDYLNSQLMVDALGKKGYVSRTYRAGKLRSTALEGFWIDVGWLWSEPMPEGLRCLELILQEDR